MLKGIMHLRKIVRAELVGSTLDSFWVADPVGSLLDSDLLRPVTSTELSHYLGGDNVHYTPVGYTKIVSGLVNSFECVRKKMKMLLCLLLFQVRDEIHAASSGEGSHPPMVP